MEHYLYGFTIHSIQSYIFQTNKLKEIAGASELVEQICTTLFAKMIGKDFDDLQDDKLAIRNAAGNIRYIFTDEAICRRVVKYFPKLIFETAPGITFSQAVVKIMEPPSSSDFGLLEKKLTAQRNNPMRPIDLGFVAIKRSPRTGLPSVEKKIVLGEIVNNDQSTKLKQNIIDNHKTTNRVNFAFFGKEIKDDLIPIDIEKITSSKNQDYSWLAIIHADGNNMGQALQNMGNEVDGSKSYSLVSKKFSFILDQSTKTSAHNAYLKTIDGVILNLKDKIPFRPIIIGGDDLTIICRADLALTFTKAYLEEFEEQTRLNFSETNLNSLKNGLTACAGIAFIKVNYPFHYAVNLAEELCSYAKKIAKSKVASNSLTPSCLLFHKVQDSFVESYNDIIERELTAQTSLCRFDFGPYYTSEKMGSLSIQKLFENVDHFDCKEGNAIKSGLRQWLTDLHYNKDAAKQRMNRLLSVGNSGILDDLGLKNTKGIIDDKSPVYDWLTISSINQNSNNDEDN